MKLLRKTAAALAAMFAGAAFVVVSGCGQGSAGHAQPVTHRSPTTEATVLAEHTALPHAVAAIEISLARIACAESFAGNRPDLNMLAAMGVLPGSDLHWDVIPTDQRNLLRNVARRLTIADQQYAKEFDAAGRPMADLDTQEIIGNAMTAATIDGDETAFRALREIYDAWPSLCL